MPRVPPFDRAATYDDLARLPDTVVAEIVDGELHATPRPAFPHAVAHSGLGMVLGGPFHLGRGGPGGWWILDEPELHFGANVLVPDLAGWRRSRLAAPPAAAYMELAPDWVCEVVSPSTAALDRGRKLALYARVGVSHAWVIDPVAKTLEVLGLDGGGWRILATHVGDAVVRAVPFDAIEIGLADLWLGGSEQV